MKGTLIHVILCRCGKIMQQEFLPASYQGRKATVMLWCGCKDTYKKRFKLVLPEIELEEVPYAPRDDVDFLKALKP